MPITTIGGVIFLREKKFEKKLVKSSNSFLKNRQLINKKFKKSKFRWLLLVCILVVLIFGILYPLIFVIAENYYVHQDQEEYIEVQESNHEIGDSVVLRVDEIIYYRFEDGKTYLAIRGAVDDDYNYPCPVLPGIPEPVVFSCDVSSKIPRFGEYFFIKGEITDIDPDGFIYIKGRVDVLLFYLLF